MRTSTGIQTEAVYIFHNMVRRLCDTQKPDYLAAVFESEGPTFRDEAFEAYKANRTETPPDLLAQIPWIRKTLEAMAIPVLEYPRFEADYVIGTIARRAAEQGIDVTIVSSDKDMLQLVDDHVTMLNPMKDDLVFDAAETEKFMGVRPDQVADLLALKGDAVDNIPGAPGIGEKGALALIQRTRRKWNARCIAKVCKIIATSFCSAKSSRPFTPTFRFRSCRKSWSRARPTPPRSASCIKPWSFIVCCAIWDRPRPKPRPSKMITGRSHRLTNSSRGSRQPAPLRWRRKR